MIIDHTFFFGDCGLQEIADTVMTSTQTNFDLYLRNRGVLQNSLG
jgi:predicted DNA-binding protein YlxM (UPF0122 family)